MYIGKVNEDQWKRKILVTNREKLIYNKPMVLTILINTMGLLAKGDVVMPVNHSFISITMLHYVGSRKLNILR